MKNVTLTADWDKYKRGRSVGLPDNIANNLVSQGLAHDPNAVAPEIPAAPKAVAKKKTAKKKKEK